MTEKNDPAHDSEDLRAIYRSGSREKVPPRLDKMVMRRARSEIRKGSMSKLYFPWGRPAAFVAVAGLSLAVLLELNETANHEQRPMTGPNIQQDFRSEAADGSTRMIDIGKTATHRFLGEDPGAGDVTAPATASEPGESLPGPVKLCDDAQVETPQSWMVCIVRLRADGHSQEANMEMGELLLTYPDFVPYQ